MALPGFSRMRLVLVDKISANLQGDCFAPPAVKCIAGERLCIYVALDDRRLDRNSDLALRKRLRRHFNRGIFAFIQHRSSARCLPRDVFYTTCGYCGGAVSRTAAWPLRRGACITGRERSGADEQCCKACVLPAAWRSYEQCCTACLTTCALPE